jgi:hypothetical protein
MLILLDLFCINRIFTSRRMRWEDRVALMGEESNVCKILAGMPEGNKELGRPERRWADNIKMDLM